MQAHRSTRLCRFLVVLFLAQPLLAFQSPLSDESVREAYFLGQRRDGSLEKLRENYSRRFSLPQTGPYISSVVLATSFLAAAQLSSRQITNYSAQQAAADHRDAGEETVQVTVEIQLTESYSQFLPVKSARRSAGQRSESPAGLVPRSGDFWKDFVIHVQSGERMLPPAAVDGRPNYRCDGHGGCNLIGATLRYDFRADAFAADSATVTVNPPEGHTVTAEFDLSKLR